MKRVEFVFEHDEVVFGKYDLMYPQTTDTRTILSSFDGECSLNQYFDEYIKWLVSIGFTKEEITQQIMTFCNYDHEVSFTV